jgi:hypothetical protein
MPDSAQGGINKKATKLASQAPTTIAGAQQEYLTDPNYLAIANLVGQLTQNPTLDPQAVSGLKTNAASEAQNAAQQSLKETHARAAGTGPGFRSGSTRGAEQNIAAQLGSNIGNANRQIDMMAEERRAGDVINAVQLAMSLLGQKAQFGRDIASAQLGGAGVIGGLPAPPSFLEGLGGFAGNTISAAGRAGGFTNLFKGIFS